MARESKPVPKTANVKRPSRSVFQLFIRNESFAGVLLLFFAILAIILANVPALAPFTVTVKYPELYSSSVPPMTT